MLFVVATDVCGSYIPSNMRVDCGYRGISRGRCLTRNCCYSVLQDIPWCFRKYPRHSTLGNVLTTLNEQRPVERAFIIITSQHRPT